MNIIKQFISNVSNTTTPEVLLKLWVKVLMPVCSFSRSSRFLILVVTFGLKLHKVYNIYFAFWLLHYLKLNRSWVETLELMRANVLCPTGVEDMYRKLVYDYSKEDAESMLSVFPWSDRLKASLCFIRGN